MALTNINNVDGRFIIRAKKYWWAYQIANAFQLSPREVKEWPADDILEALAAIGLSNKNMPKLPD